jgi:hypothetical protein
MNPNCKPVHARVYTVLISVEQNYKKARTTQDWWTLEFLKKTFPLIEIFLFLTFMIHKKNGAVTKRELSLISGNPLLN